ncbi:excinuclease ATPase subunit [Acidovorax sp. A1169]|uniref:excinuclease ATPase subunit n=1 Tax=Acidovorax sp. A1169 TaxID=3059524 RepID=UPI0027379BA2|nr:excinuclease ATPase subunit [Acidovorax sp. A1169]MDP4076784.1 excinuclease ATPase subunit [Acidovorax sp. A1169]
MTKQLVLALALLSAATVAHAREEKASLLPLEETVARGIREGKLDGSVTFHLSGAPAPQGTATPLGEEYLHRRTSNIGKELVFACHWAALSGLIALQENAKKRGANAVVDLHSFYKEKTVKDPVHFECNQSSYQTVVAFKGTYVRTAP